MSILLNYFCIILSFGGVVFGALRIIFPEYDSYIVWGMGGWIGCAVFQILFRVFGGAYFSWKDSQKKS